MNQRWIKQTKGIYDFDVTKADKFFEFLVKECRIRPKPTGDGPPLRSVRSWPFSWETEFGS
jgi:hypothetical protein